MLKRNGSRLIREAVIALAMAVVLLAAACSDDPMTPTAGTSGEGAPNAAPTVEVSIPTPTETQPPTPSPTVIPFSATVPLPPTPTATLAPDASEQTFEEWLDQVRESLPSPRMGHQAITLNDGRILFVGGELPIVANNGVVISQPHPLVEVYDPVREEWSLEHTFDQLMVFPETLQLANGDILVHVFDLRDVDVTIEEVPGPSAFVMDGETLAITPVASPLAKRVSPEMALLDDGRVLAAGGIELTAEADGDTVPYSLAVEIYDPATDVWTESAPQPHGLERSFNTWNPDYVSQWALPLPGARALTVRLGELDEDGFDNKAVVFDIFDATAQSWESLTPLRVPDRDLLPWHVAASINGAINLLYTDRIESFYPSNSAWVLNYPPDTVTPEDAPDDEELIGLPRQVLARDASITELPDGRFLIAGGERGGGSSLPRSPTVLFDPSTRLWALGPKLATTRSSHSATVLSDDSVLLSGGVTVWEENESEGVPTNSVEIISAAEIAAVDTGTIPAIRFGRPNPLIDYPCRNVASTPFRLPVVTDDQAELPEAQQLLTDAADAFDSVTSFFAISLIFDYEGEPDLSANTIIVDYEGEPGLDVMEARGTGCSSSFTTYESPGRALNEVLIFDNRSLREKLTTLTADQNSYTYSRSEGLWTAGRQVDDFDTQVREAVLMKETLDDSALWWTTVAIEELNGIEVYHVRGVEMEFRASWESGSQFADSQEQTRYAFHYWIGVDDLLVRRIYGHIDSIYQTASQYDRVHTYLFTAVTGFGEEFNIQPPSEDEIANP